MSCVTSNDFPKELRLRRKTEFQKISKNGKKFYTENFIILIVENGLEYSRIGITVTKKYGKAVKRNRMKRLIREFFRLNKRLFGKGYDFLIIVKNSCSILNYNDIKEELTFFLKNEKIFNN